jgi:GcrA cell cycle regulator
MSWTNKRIELLQKPWFEGSASRIAGELAHEITRNAVIGKVYRLGRSGRAKGLRGNVPASPPRHKAPWRPAYQHANSPQVAGNTALALHPFLIEAAAPPMVRDVVVPISEPVNCRAKDHIAPAMRTSPIKPNMTGGASGGRKVGLLPSLYDCWA